MSGANRSDGELNSKHKINTDSTGFIAKSGSMGNQPVKDSFRNTKWRWAALFFGCFFLLGSYFWYDNPNSLSDQLSKHVTNGSDFKYNQLYSVYSYPNIILPLLGGVLIDKFGLPFSIYLFSTLLVIGQGVFTVSGFLGINAEDGAIYPFIIAIIGRVIFGLGGESLSVCQSTIISRWFVGKELSLALGINISVSRLGSVFNNYSMPPFAEATNLGWALFFGFVLCIISFICGAILTWFEKYANKIDNEDGGLKDDEKEEFHWSDIKEFSMSFWLIAANWVFTYIGLFCFNNISNDFFAARYGMSQQNSARITSNVFLISAFLAPIFGVISDKIGHKVTFCIVSTTSLAMWHALFIILPYSTEENVSYIGVIPIVGLGITYSIYVAALWPMIPLVVKPQVVGSAFGLCTALQNIGLALGPIMVSLLTDTKKGEDGILRDGTNRNGFIWVNVALGSFALLGLLCSFALLYSDRVYYKGLLQKPSSSSEEEYVDITTTPTQAHNPRNLAEQNSDLREYTANKGLRNKMKRSMARSSMAK